MENVIILRPDELRNFFTELKTELFQQIGKKEEAPIGVKEACQFLKGIHPETLRRKMKKGLPFHTDTDGEYYFYASEINHWIKTKKK